MKKLPVILLFLAVLSMSFFIATRWSERNAVSTVLEQTADDQTNDPLDFGTAPADTTHPLTIEALRNTTIVPSEIVIEEELPPGSNYSRYLTSYTSEGLKIYALLTIPTGEQPTTGWPTIVFNHGYIPPDEYRTTERYIAYTDAFSRNGYILFRPDYRGHGNSEGEAAGGYGSNAYTIDVLHAVAALQNHPDVDASRIGMWGHSMGGFITLRSMVVNPSIRAGVIWAGVVASYPDLLNNWHRGTGSPTPLPSPLASAARRWRQTLTETYGTPAENPAFWNSISANSYLSELAGPVQIHHGTADSSVPVAFSETLAAQLTAAEKAHELYIYSGDDHNLSRNFSTAMQRSVSFFDEHLKGEIQ